MAWGLWNKIKQGFKKAGAVVKKIARTVTDKVIKPFKPVISAAANAFNPALGKIVDKGMDSVERWSDTAARPQGWAADGGESIGKALDWAKSKWG